MDFEHISVLKDESIEYLNIQPNKNYVDGTLGKGGHSYEILKHNSPKGLLLGIDRDPEALAAAKDTLREFGDRAILVNDTFNHINNIVYDNGLSTISGVLLDLGVSSHQLTSETRGFSFRGSAKLDMRMGAGEITAADIVNSYSQDQLQSIFSKYGEERYSKTIAQKIVEYRESQKFETTDQLVEVIEGVYANRPKTKIHPATKVFQALRIEVNQEFEILEEALENILEVLEVGGRIAIITFHSLEDRIVKEFFKKYKIQGKVNKYGKDERDGVLEILTKKPIVPSEKEVKANPRSRSAKLRVAQKLK